MTSEFPAQRASNAENFSIWWRHHATVVYFDELVHIGSDNSLSLVWGQAISNFDLTAIRALGTYLSEIWTKHIYFEKIVETFENVCKYQSFWSRLQCVNAGVVSHTQK